jgi:hypothetical protein
VSDVAGLLPAAFTVEFWLRFDGADYDPKDPSTFVPHRLVAARTVGGGVWYAAIDLANQSVTCALYEPGPPKTSLAVRHDLPTPPRSYHHVACELGEDGIGMWYDGEYASWADPQAAPVVFEHDGLPIVIGQGDGASPLEPEPLVRFAGALDEVRFSNGALYAPHFDQADGLEPDSFTPEPTASVLDTTTALFHFDECRGSTAVNSGPEGGDAMLEDGATWLSRPGQTP